MLSSDLHAIKKLIEKNKSNQLMAKGKAKVSNLGLIAFLEQVTVNNVNFYEPCLIFVLEGIKTLHLETEEIQCFPGQWLAVAAPSQITFSNTPSPETGQYYALVIPIPFSDLAQFEQNQPSTPFTGSKKRALVQHFSFQQTLVDSLKHYLSTDSALESILLTHRVLELLLILKVAHPDLLTFLSRNESWGQKVRMILSEDLAFAWNMQTICTRLAVSESKLRRKLQHEGESFREILKALKLNAALMMLIQSNLPINQIASENGYDSASRFADNFKKQFGLTPSEFRNKKIETG